MPTRDEFIASFDNPDTARVVRDQLAEKLRDLGLAARHRVGVTRLAGAFAVVVETDLPQGRGTPS